MRIALYTFTRDRFELSRVCLSRLWAVGLGTAEIEHLIVDNGSEDETRDWLLSKEFVRRPEVHVSLLDSNRGIAGAEEIALRFVRDHGPFDAVVKFDNDCFVQTPEAVAEVARLVGPTGWVLSPRVEGINRQPSRSQELPIGGYRVGEVGHVGGLCRVSPYEVAVAYRPDTELPLAWGQDEDYVAHARSLGARFGYVEDLVVEHYLTTDGQAERYPDYFVRKHEEEGNRSPRRIKRR